ncbi:intracellular proteinase inhibitor [Alkalihalophilus pseudofirmus OF4]|uniref:Intracellular proteinase inhibitor n=1 Tax=Alkalihalophilus pseudofirmus (strain ATCC BAA-2126 / JCM 17055 / OF4) TaxID=398511 RepID=D3FVK8_ALKPO|nr:MULTISPECIES: BsuPI-related putative proteinase inhibitor [Alkalihalophilus]ADC48523.1 intracellular proteinase inhibitor [Alkalihalophilus pseudofirmus OF4]MED1600981.1 BsuPI-related putative proteinase inhibitor [Alkalihalophilus marmarensis]
MKHIFSIFMALGLIFMTACGQTATSPGGDQAEGDDAAMNSDWAVNVTTEQNGEGEVVVDIEITNQMDEAATLDFTSGQKYELVVVDEEGNEVYRYSNEMMFTMALTSETFEPGETKSYQETLSTDQWSSSTHTIYIEVVAAAVDGEEVENKEQFKAESTIELE